jgi:hypothetical protein
VTVDEFSVSEPERGTVSVVVIFDRWKSWKVGQMFSFAQSLFFLKSAAGVVEADGTLQESPRTHP